MKCCSKSEGVDPYQPWQMTDREREIATKYLNWIQGKRLKRDPSLLSLTPLGGEAPGFTTSNPLSPETPVGGPQGMPSPCQDSQVFVPSVSFPTEPSPFVSAGNPELDLCDSPKFSILLSNLGNLVQD